jgi:hypothetical protein
MLTSLSYLESDTVKLVVGEEERTFTVHRSLLKSSKFFTACLDSGFREGVEGVITLKDDAVDMVTQYLYWLYRRTIDPSHQEDHDYCYQVYAFGWKIIDHEYCNALMYGRVIHEAKFTIHNFEDIQKIYARGLRNTPLAKYSIRLLLNYLRTSESYVENMWGFEFLQPQVALEVIQDLIPRIIECQNETEGRVEGLWPFEMPKCTWHIHEDGTSCGL